MKTRKPLRFLHRNRLQSSLIVAMSILPVAGSLTVLPARAQVTPTSGAIQGTVTDTSGAAIPGAEVTIIDTNTNSTRKVTTDGAGYYTSGSLVPGSYQVAIVATGFQQLKATTIVNVNVVTSGNYKLPVGNSSETVQVTAGQVQTNTEQSSVQNVLTAQQIETLPINGRNFLDLAQLEPGVQLQSGESFDPTKAGYSALSFSGASGRTTRIQLDGQDITDETVGTTIFNVSQGAIDQVQISRSTQDITGDLTSTGSVQAATRSGTNAFHGLAYYNFQDHGVGFASQRGVDTPFQRNQFGGSIGGPIIKDKLFFFANSERIKQDLGTISTVGSLFSGVLQQFPFIPTPFRDTYSTGRLDYSGPHGIHFFARANYEANSAVSSFGLGYSIYSNRDNTPGIAGGADFVTGNFTHSIRVSYEKFHNLLVNAVNPGTTYYAVPGIEFRYISQGLYSGPNYLAPQGTYQSDKQFRYDGSWTKSSHNIRFGGGFNRILGGGTADFFGTAPRVTINSSSLLPGQDAANPLNYSAFGVVLGNGQGYFTEQPQFNLPAGGQGDWRTFAYVADSWKIRPNFTVNYGVRWIRDTGRSDADLAPIPCSAVDTSAAGPGYNPCASPNDRLLDQFGAGLGARVNQPNYNFAPQLGFAYSPGASGKTVIRAGIGVFYENSVFNNVLFDRPFKLKQGAFNSSKQLCSQYGNYSFVLPDGTTVDNYNGTSIQALCSESIQQSGPAFAALQAQYQKATAGSGGVVQNPDYVGSTLAIPTAAGYSAYAPDFKTAYATQVNFGVQQELWKGSVLTVDYLHSVTNHIQQGVDANRVGDARFFDKTAGAAAVTKTVAQCGATSVDQAIAACGGLHPAGPGTRVGGATIQDFAKNGLDSGVQFNSGYPVPGTIAFAGRNPQVGQGIFQSPTGRAGYDALQFNFRQQARHPLPGLTDTNFEASYSFSREVSSTAAIPTSGSGSDGFFTPTAWDYNQPTRFIGSGNLDRRHILSFGGSSTVKYGPRIGIIGHIYSAQAANLLLDTTTNGGKGQIFQTDWTGDGTIGDLVPGSDPGYFQRQVTRDNLGKFINRYNSKFAGTLTPAGQTVVNNGVLSAAQLSALGGVMQPIGVPTGPTIRNYPFRTIDANFSYPIHLHKISESMVLEPGVAMYNVANFGNYKDITNGGDQELLIAPGAGDTNYVNGPFNFATKDQNRITRGAGTFDQGDARSTEFQLKLTF